MSSASTFQAPDARSSGPLAGVNGPLAGVKVVDLSINVLGPMATQILGDMGADVIKVETPRGDDNRRTGPSRGPDMAALFLTFNRNKRSIVLDLKRADHHAALLRLVDGADVFVHGMRPKAADKLGIGYAALAARNPRLVYGYGTGYRRDGPHADRPAFDDIIQGASGLAGLLARADGGEPRYIPTTIVDKLCGYLLAGSLAMALYARERTGRGQEVTVPMMETSVAFLLHEHLFNSAFDPPLGPPGYPRMFTPHRRPYATRDGYISVVAINDEQWKRLLPALGKPELVADPRFATIDQRTVHINTLYGVVAEQLKTRTTGEWQRIFDAADLPNSPVRKIEDLPDDPYLKSTGFFRHFDTATEGRLVTTDIPVQFSETPGALRYPPPRLGEHGEEILREAGFNSEEIDALLGAKSGAN
ncbi:MAG TPA: CoA transferase [Burkholderiales bacterium]|nr:CoA transferase [Burkholderiales bacterium]